MDRKQLGNYGEDLAAAHLKRLGYRILERNWRCRLGELDIVAEENKTIVFVEVKIRTSLEFGRPELAVANFKQKRIVKIAVSYIQQKKLFNRDLRFDVLAIGPDSWQIIKNAFTAERYFML